MKNKYEMLLKTYLQIYSFQEPDLEIRIINEVLDDESKPNRFEEVVKWLYNQSPIQYYAGYTYTFGKKLFINKNVMIPGPEMDIFINTVKKYSSNGDKIMELCTGSGVVPVMLGMEYNNSEVYASDISDKALEIAQKNVDLYELKNVSLLQGDMFKPFEERQQYEFDILVSNPPYAESGNIEKLSHQLKDNMPRISLDGGDDGLYFYRLILKDAYKFLKKNGYVIFENGEDQSEDIQKLLIENNYKVIEVVKDRIDVTRFVVGQLQG